MAWQTALDRLVLQQIHRAEKNEIRPAEVRQQILDMLALEPKRVETLFHLGYARALLGLDLPEPPASESSARWYGFGRLSGHDRRGERNWVAELLQQPAALLDLLSDPKIAPQCIPLVMRTLFWCGDLSLAIKAIEYLTVDGHGPDSELLVDAALTDLLTRLENRTVREDQEPTASILQKCMELPSFERLPADVRARYHRAIGVCLLGNSEFEAAGQQLELAGELAAGSLRLRSSILMLAALAKLRLHDLDELEPRVERPEREQALACFARQEKTDRRWQPDTLFVRGILSYEVGEFEAAAGYFDEALRTLQSSSSRQPELLDRIKFFLAASLLGANDREEASRALRLMDQALERVRPDLESFFSVHDALKSHDRKLAIRFLDAVDVGRGTAPDHILFICLEYLSLGDPEQAAAAAERVLQVASDLDQRIEALRVLLTARNMQGKGTREIYDQIHDLLMRRGKFAEMEALLKNEEFVGQALDYLEIKCELVMLYEEMEDREYEKAMLQTAIARSLRARKDVDSLQEAFGVLKEVEIDFPDMAREDLKSLEKLLLLSNAEPADPCGARSVADQARRALKHDPKILVVGGNERQRRHHPRFATLCQEWGLDGEWLMANYTSPQKLVNTIAERLKGSLDLLILLHWNRHETTEPGLELARKQGVAARTVHYAGFTSLQVCITDMLGKLTASETRV